MRILKVNKPHQCKFRSCPVIDREISTGTKAVMTTKRLPEGQIFASYYHPDCFIQERIVFVQNRVAEFDARVLKKKQKREAKKQALRSQGRPRMSDDPIKYRSLQALYKYHKQLGHTERMEQIQNEIMALVKEVSNDNIEVIQQEETGMEHAIGITEPVQDIPQI